MKDIASEAYVIGPDGERMTLADMPSPETERWVPRRKAKVVAAVDGGLISEDDALSRYRLTPEELGQWRLSLRRHGMKGLRVTQAGRFRRASE